MCNGHDVLAQIKRHAAVKCTANTQCWCMKLQACIPHFDNVCMSPAELLKEHESILTVGDLSYLQALSTREFMSS